MTFDEKISYLTGRGTLVRHADFTDSAWFAFNPTYPTGAGIEFGIGHNNGGDLLPTQDNSVKASGKSSMKFTIPTLSGASGSGYWWMNFASDLSVQFGAGQSFSLQFQQRFGSYFATHVYSGGNGWKQCIVGSGDQVGCVPSPWSSPPCMTSCSDLEVVIQNTFHRGIPQMYNSCSGCDAHGAFDSFEAAGPIGSSPDSAPNLQNGYSDGSGHYCTYGNVVTNGDLSHCFAYYPDEWLTFTLYITPGSRSNNVFTSSHVDLYAARENATTASRVLDWGPYGLCAGTPAVDQKFGKIWLLPYNTNKSAAESHQEDYTWYANPIIASELIPTTTTEISAVGGRHSGLLVF